MATSNQFEAELAELIENTDAHPADVSRALFKNANEVAASRWGGDDE